MATVMATVIVAAMQQSPNAAGGNGMEGGAYCGGGGNDDNDGIGKRPIRAAMVMVMARATSTVATAVGQ